MRGLMLFGERRPGRGGSFRPAAHRCTRQDRRASLHDVHALSAVIGSKRKRPRSARPFAFTGDTPPATNHRPQANSFA